MNAVLKDSQLVAANAGHSLTAADIRQHVNLIQEVMLAVMKKDVHYGVIPGCKVPSLYKAGSEVLLSTFRIAVSVFVEDLSTADCVHYRVRTVGTHQGSGIIVGEGVGECSSNEGKYKWRRCYIKQEFDATPETRRRMKFSQYQGKVSESMEVRTDPADVANTILKMAKKRAQIDLTLTATAASDCFTQDIEDLPEELREQEQREKVTPTAGAWDSCDDKTRATLTDCATRAKELIEIGDAESASDYIDTLNLSNDHKIALWTRFTSDEKTALKKVSKKAAK